MWNEVKTILEEMGCSTANVTISQVKDTYQLLPHLREVFDELTIVGVIQKLGIKVYSEDSEENIIYTNHEYIITQNNKDEYIAYSVNPFSELLSFTIRAKYKTIKSIEYISPTNAVFSKEKKHQSTSEKLLNDIIREALELKASDIHIYPRNNDNIFIKYRVFGEYIESNIPDISITEYPTFANKLLLAANENPGTYSIFIEKKINYEGTTIRLQQNPSINHFPIEAGGDVIPSYVLRVHAKSKANFMGINDLQLTETQKNIINGFSIYNQGVIVVAGPTGSGKTTLLYAILDLINNANNRVIQTIEDPVEISIPGIKQLNINEKGGITYNNAMLSALRSDNDAVLIGETRSSTTAQKMIELDETGHLVLTTLHAKNTLSIIDRLKNFGIDNLKIADSLKLLISTRLVKTVCSHCSQTVELGQSSPRIKKKYQSFIKKLPRISVKEANNKGCEHCNFGYQGRVLISELVVVDNTLRSLIINNASSVELYNHIFNNHNENTSFWDNGMQLVIDQRTTIEALEQVLPPFEGFGNNFSSHKESEQI